MVAGGQAQMFRECFADIGKADLPDIPAALSRQHADNGNPLAGVVSPCPGRIVAVVAGEKDQVVRSQFRQNARHLAVKPLQRTGIARHVPLMPEKRIEFDKINENQCIIRRNSRDLDKVLEQIRIILSLVGAGNAVAGKISLIQLWTALT